MYLNEKPEEIISSNEVTGKAMAALYEMVIEPMEESLATEDMELINVIGVALTLVAEKATLYEDMIQNGHGSNYGSSQDFSRN